MKRLILFFIPFILMTALFSNLLYAQDEIRIWKEFVASLKTGVVPPSF